MLEPSDHDGEADGNAENLLSELSVSEAEHPIPDTAKQKKPREKRNAKRAKRRADQAEAGRLQKGAHNKTRRKAGKKQPTE